MTRRLAPCLVRGWVRVKAESAVVRQPLAVEGRRGWSWRSVAWNNRRMHTLLLTIHIIGACTWLGANMVLAFVGASPKKPSVEVQAWWADTQGKMARVLYNVAGGILLVTGVILLLVNDWKFSSHFVSVGFLALIIGGGLGMGVFGPGSRQLAAALREGRLDEAEKLNKKLAAFGALDTVVIVLTIVAMVARWGLKV